MGITSQHAGSCLSVDALHRQDIFHNTSQAIVEMRAKALPRHCALVFNVCTAPRSAPPPVSPAGLHEHYSLHATMHFMRRAPASHALTLLAELGGRDKPSHPVRVSVGSRNCGRPTGHKSLMTKRRESRTMKSTYSRQPAILRLRCCCAF